MCEKKVGVYFECWSITASYTLRYRYLPVCGVGSACALFCWADILYARVDLKSK